jgi:Cu/Ag efflux protein CusF
MQRTARAAFAALILVLAVPCMADGPQGAPRGTPIARGVRGTGVIKAIDVAHASLTLSHQAITALQWPAMTMPFRVADAKMLGGRSVGETVTFELGGDSMHPLIVAIAPAK